MNVQPKNLFTYIRADRDGGSKKEMKVIRGGHYNIIYLLCANYEDLDVVGQGKIIIIDNNVRTGALFFFLKEKHTHHQRQSSCVVRLLFRG